jgi:hypothetical protein
VPIKLEQRPIISVGETEVAKIDYTEYLDADELLTGTPTIVEVTTTDLTLTNKAVSTEVVRVLERDVAIGKAVLFKVSGQKINTEYSIRITVSTDGERVSVRDAILKTV